MGELTRSYNWELTPIGSFDKWPQSLRTTIRIILRSDFPMFLWCGEEMIQFYNDAYRPSLGNAGKHPKALGQRAEECWPEIWEIISPLVQRVRQTGNSFFSEDQLVPIFRKKRTEELAESNASLQRSNEELRQFAYIASHDLQEPARKIRTFSEMLRKSLGKIDERSDSYLTKIDTSASRMLMLIRDVLAFSQLSETREEFIKIDLNEILEIVKSDFELLIDEKNARIESKALPIIAGIPVQIIQLFSNLISNSLKFAYTDKQPHIIIDFDELNETEIRNHQPLNPACQYYRLSFRDNGIGFSQDNATQIFDIFQRLHARTEYQGTGIGLAICRKIAQTHNGHIYAESTPGAGATFHVLVPRPD